MGRKRKGSVIGDIGKMLVDTVASPLEALTGQNFVDFKYTSDFGKGASKVVEPINKAIGGATVALGTTALNALAPGAGTALSGFGQGLGQGMKQNSVQQPPMQMSNKTRPTSGINSVPYGVQESMPKTGYRHGGMLKTYNAPTHENGGQMIDQNANPTNNPNKAVGEIEKKETSWNGYVFSDTLGEGKKTFAQMSKEIVNRYKGKRDNLSKKTMEKELMLLIQKNEAARLEKEQMEMQQMQNQFTEEELATLQNPQSPSKEQLDRLFAQQQQQQQGQPSQEQMMQMMQQQQMQQQGAPQDMGQYRWGGNMDVPMYRYQDGGGLDDIDSKMMGQQKIVTNTALPKDSVPTNIYQQIAKGFFEAVAPQKQRANYNYYEQQNQFAQPFLYDNYPFQNVADIPQEMNMQQETMKQPNTPKMPKQPKGISTLNLQNANQEFDSKGGIVYQNGGMLEVPEAPLDEYKKGGWIQKVTKSIKKRGTEGVCTGDKFGGPSCPPGSKRYNLAKTFRAMAKKEDGGYIDSLPDLNLANYEDGGIMEEYKDGGMIKRADGSYSKRGLWDNIRDNIGSGKKPTKEMLEQERKIKAQEYRDGGYVVTRSNERKGKTHKVTGPDGSVKFFGDPDLKNNPSEKARDAFYARHKKNLEGNPHFRAYARATWRDGGMIPEYPDGGGLEPFVPYPGYGNTVISPGVGLELYDPRPQSIFLKNLRFKTTPQQDANQDIDEDLDMNRPYYEPRATTFNNQPVPIEYPSEKEAVAKSIEARKILAERFQKPYIAYENQRAPFTASTENPFDVNTHYSNVPIPNPYYRKKAMDVLGLGNLNIPASIGFVPSARNLKLNSKYSVYPGREETATISPGTGPQIRYTTEEFDNFQGYNEPILLPVQQNEPPVDYTFLDNALFGEASTQTQQIPYAPEYKPETPTSPTTPEEDPFKLRPLEYATIGLKGAALGKSIYDALQPAEKEQLRLNREAGLVNNMMAGRNVNMAAALNEALYNRNAALASNQARSANVQRALDMQTYSNAERNAIRAKLEEQNMNNQLRMQEAQVRADLGAAEAAERVRRQNVQSMNEAARRQFGQKAFQDLSTIGTELNKVQVYKDMYKNMKNMSYNKFKEYVTALNEAGAGKFKLKTPTEQDFNAMQMGNFDFDQVLEFMKS
jgi:hypothetical protein